MDGLKNLFKIFFVLLLAIGTNGFGQNQKRILAPIQFEHIRINVANKEATAQWYVANLGLEIIKSDYKDLIYLADKDHNFMIELSQIPDLKNTYFDVPIDGFHIAFEGHKAIESVAQKMLSSGGVQDGKLYTNLIGDYVLNIRDPNGFSTQLLHRVNPFYSKPIKGTLRFEHFAFNTPDQKTQGLWFVEFMDLQIPWSKDIDTLHHNLRNYRVPYVGDAGRNMSLELFGKKEVEMTLSKMKHNECHLAFLTNEPEELAKRMVYGGAKIIVPIWEEPNGDRIIDLLDPSNFPIRLMQRRKPILIKK